MQGTLIRMDVSYSFHKSSISLTFKYNTDDMQSSQKNEIDH